MRVYSRKRRTIEEIRADLDELDELEAVMDAELEVKERQIELHERHLDEHAQDVTLDDVLEAMMHAMDLCKRMGVWRK